MSRDAAVGSVVTRVMATDADSGLNARLVYAIVAGNDRSAFYVDPLTGTISLAVPGHALDLDRYLLSVSVSDCGQPPLTSSVQLTIDVTSPLIIGGIRLSLIMIMVTVGGILSLVVAIVVVVIVVVKCRRSSDVQSDVQRPTTTTSKTPAVFSDHLNDDDDESLPALGATHLPRSLDTRSRDLLHSAATLNAAGHNDTSTWLEPLDCSAISAPAACQASTVT